MQKYNMTCTCGDVMSVDAASRDEAVGKLKAMMTQAAVDAHWTDKHQGQPNKPTLEQSHKMIEQTTVLAA